MSDHVESFLFNTTAGEITDKGIRYLLMRPDVIMGMFTHLDEKEKKILLKAFSQSAYLNGRKSLQLYKERGIGDSIELLAFTCKTAARLGWGSWKYSIDSINNITIVVENSPFAFGVSESSCPVCAPITGMLSAFNTEIFNVDKMFIETECVSQGYKSCTFKVDI